MDIKDSSLKKEQHVIKQYRKYHGENTITSRGRDFLHFLIDYNIISFTVSFIVARASYKVIESSIPFMVRSVIGWSMKDDINQIVLSFISLIITLLTCFLFIYYIFQPLVSSKTISEERKLRDIVKKAEEQNIKEQANRANSTYHKTML